MTRAGMERVLIMTESISNFRMSERESPVEVSGTRREIFVSQFVDGVGSGVGTGRADRRYIISEYLESFNTPFGVRFAFAPFTFISPLSTCNSQRTSTAAD